MHHLCVHQEYHGIVYMYMYVPLILSYMYANWDLTTCILYKTVFLDRLQIPSVSLTHTLNTTPPHNSHTHGATNPVCFHVSSSSTVIREPPDEVVGVVWG